jgi:hypothetical protein
MRRWPVPTDGGMRGGGFEPPSNWDDALARLEEFLLTYPAERALPDPEDLVRVVELPDGYLRDDDRARKVYLDALGARPLSDISRISVLNTEVELLTVEVEFIKERLSRRVAGGSTRRELRRRLVDVRQRLEEIQRLL